MMVSGMVLIAAGIAVLATTQDGRPLWCAEIGLFLTGIGMALNTGPVLATAVSAVEHARAGTASGMVNTARMIGATLGVGILGSVFASGGGSGVGFHSAMSIGAEVALGGAALATLCLS